MHALIVLGGDAPDARLLERCMRSADLVLAADRGLEAFHFAGLTPDMLIGDMDSVAPEVLARYEGKLAEHRLSCIKDDTKGDTVSLLPLGEARGVSLRGFFYPLEDATLTTDYPIGVSNVVTRQEASVCVREGDLFLFHYFKEKEEMEG